jgi:hypothetical protein
MVDKALSRVAEATGALTGDETLRPRGARWVGTEKPCASWPSQTVDGKCKPERPAKSRASTERRTKLSGAPGGWQKPTSRARSWSSRKTVSYRTSGPTGNEPSLSCFRGQTERK